MRHLVRCDEQLQAQLETAEARHTTEVRILAEGAAADACEAKIKSLSTSLCSAEKSLESVISSTQRILASAKKAGEAAPSAADIVSTAQRIAFTSKLPPYPQPGDCRFRHPWPTEGELRSSRYLFGQAPAEVPSIVPEKAEGQVEAPSLSLKRTREEALGEMAQGSGTPRWFLMPTPPNKYLLNPNINLSLNDRSPVLKSPKKGPTSAVDIGAFGADDSSSESEESGSGSDDD